ncbi:MULTISPECIES: carbohydrate porin [unclassified Janthinobacterium]|uniref:maltoporin n=1 Tax=unclassified Janthinobacterium TaxID=2610881 RepID=UPI001E45DB79|nr:MULTISPECIES: carbohydrate porin [unclassified Janthinobacterium]MCC7645559.1 carbohydrate porin [Janthinobacterium sp. EB271-G4-3-1]MCC7689505.1 carbohydrate porin [Janthinobacterium sp. EB271-G4-3-2]
MQHPMKTSLALACAMLLACGAAHASDAEGEYHGYFRAGLGSSTDSRGPQSCYGLGGNTMRYRLGNECDTYGEFEYQKEMAKSANGVSFVGHIMVAAYTPSSAVSDSDLSMSKMYVEAKNIEILNGGTAWIGKRYYMRPDIHMLDLQYINMNGTGGGIDQYKLGPGRISYGFFKDNDKPGNSAIRQNLVYQGIPINQDGTLEVLTTLITPDKKDSTSHSGWQATVLHKQDKVWGGANTFGIQYGVGPGTGAGGQCCNRMGTTGSIRNGSDVTRLRIFNSLWIQPTPEWSAEMIAIVQRDKSDATGGSSTWTTLGVRPVYAVNDNFKLQFELGTDRVTSPTGGAAQRLTKLTFAPTLTAGKGYWSRPELRAFVTYGKWNDAATAAVNKANESGPVYGNATSGTSFGLQVETWF